MNDDTVRNLLKQLHGKLEGATSISEPDRRLLKELSGDIDALLARPGATAGGTPRSIGDRLQAAVMHFEVSHPELTATISQVSKALGDMGI